MTIDLPKRAEGRLSRGVKKFHTILGAAHKRDANESDKVAQVIFAASDFAARRGSCFRVRHIDQSGS